jgi:6,7-dimethyl-8-ribityllumazine synthase
MRASPSRTASHEASAEGMRCVVVASRFNEAIVERLVDGAWRVLVARGADQDRQTVVWVPGALEIPLMAQALVSQKKRRPHAVICVGCVIEGGTDHYEHVCRATVDGIMRVGLDHRAVVTNGVLTVKTLEQARERAGGEVGNKGAEAAQAAIDTWATLTAIGSA